MKHYPAEFKAEAVALYRARPGRDDQVGCRRPGRERLDAAQLDPAGGQPPGRGALGTPAARAGGIGWLGGG
jgi:hypothetical protein